MAEVNSTAPTAASGGVISSGAPGSVPAAATSPGLTAVGPASRLLTDVFWAVSNSSPPPAQATSIPVHPTDQPAAPATSVLGSAAVESAHLPSGPPLPSSSVSLPPAQASVNETGTLPPPASTLMPDPKTATSLGSVTVGTQPPPVPVGTQPAPVDPAKDDHTAVSLVSSHIASQVTTSSNPTATITEPQPAIITSDTSMPNPVTAVDTPSILGMTSTGVPNNPKKVVAPGTHSLSAPLAAQSSLTSSPDLSFYQDPSVASSQRLGSPSVVSSLSQTKPTVTLTFTSSATWSKSGASLSVPRVTDANHPTGVALQTSAAGASTFQPLSTGRTPSQSVALGSPPMTTGAMSSDVAANVKQDASDAPPITPTAVTSTLTVGTISPIVIVSGNQTTVVASGQTMTGQAAIAALAAAQTGGSLGADQHITSSTGTTLSSFAIIGIVGGILIGFLILYMIWFRWRKNRRARALNEKDEKRKPPNDVATRPRSSFGDDPFLDKPTGYSEPTWYRHSGYNEGYNERYDERAHERHTERHNERHDDQYHDQYHPGYNDNYNEGSRGTQESGLAEEALEEALREHQAEMRASGAWSLHNGAERADRAIPDPRLSSRHSDIGTRQSSVSTRSNPFGEDIEEDQQGYPPSATTSRRAPDSRAESYAYGSIYARYAENGKPSRVGTQYDGALATPATSTLLPWLATAPETPPPMPQAARASHARSIGSRDMRRAASGPQKGSKPVPAMAQSPAVRGGWEGVIPPFR